MPENPRAVGGCASDATSIPCNRRLARSSATVLVYRESGTGKELVARAYMITAPALGTLHRAEHVSHSSRSPRSGALRHERGSFTGADAQRRGRFEQANGGTIFLDEIGDMSTTMQTRLLRVLARGVLSRGGQTSILADARIIAATHRNLQECVKQGSFREDLYHRLNVIQIQLPPLRQRSRMFLDCCVTISASLRGSWGLSLRRCQGRCGAAVGV